MSYPFADTPANKRLSDLIDQCISKDSIIKSESDSHIFHVLPKNHIVYNNKIEDFEIYADQAACFIFDKISGQASAFMAFNHDNRTPVLSNKNSISFKQFYEDLESGDTGILHEHFPQYFEHDGRLKTKIELMSMLSFRYQNMEYHSATTSFIDASNLKEDSLKDFRACIDKTHRHGAIPSIMLEVKDGEKYSDIEMGFIRTIEQSMKERMEDFINSSISMFYSEVSTAWERDNPEVDVKEIQKTAELMREYFPEMRSDKKEFDHVNGFPFKVVRNRLQLLTALNNSQGAWVRLLANDDAKACIDQGRPLKEALSSLPLLATSKKSIRSFLHNLEVIQEEGHKVEKDRTKKIILEKGPEALTSNDKWRDMFSYRFSLLNYASLITTLPESYFAIPDREHAVSNMMDMFELPYMEKTLTNMIAKVKNGEQSLKQSLSWVPGFIERMAEDIPSYDGLVTDAEGIVDELYLGAIVYHLRLESDLEKYGKPAMGRVTAKIQSHLNIMDDAAKSGNYRNVINVEKKVHMYNQALHKEGKPDAELEWEPTITSPFTYNDFTIHPINSNHALTEEGSVMGHCVASYLKRVLEEESYILSITQNGKKVATLELTGDHKSDIEIAQLRGYNNAECDESVHEAVNALINKIRAGDILFEFNPCDDMESSLEDLDDIEREEVELGLRFSDRNFILTAISHLEDIAASADIFSVLKEESGIEPRHVDQLEEEFRAQMKQDTSLQQ